MLSLLPQINVQQTKKAAREVLSRYRSLERIAGQEYSISLVPTLSDMPRAGKKAISKIESLVQRKVDVEKEALEILDACQKLPQLSYEILYFKYLQKENWTNTQIQLHMQDQMNESFSERDFERKLANALLEFAEAYKGGKLLDFRIDT
ncbi:transcriptional regulator [Listeria aquatica]|uniref:Transcriptional regulator n=1 Tax=Listeria aquatica TaxID=1494960 RepID=A0A841ZL56_9LIST|nr:ArpU family phage packaging/lysis transcriptional regulator [Listeria aquatica]MBC1521419.1 transcriptional regulator [Listeria aquatica]